MSFNVEKSTRDIVEWIREWFKKNGIDCNAVVGISGGKDSSVVAALCVEALGKDRVIGVLMPRGEQADIDMAELLVKSLEIKSITVNIKDMYDATISQLEKNVPQISNMTIVNLPPRLRMTMLYAVSQSVNGRVANTCNLSEDWVGYSTRYGDSVGDFSPLSNFTVTEVKEIGRYLGLPDVLVDKVPIDGLCGKTDEENLGFSYDMLDKYIRTGVCEDEDKKARIDSLHYKNLFKLERMDCFVPKDI